jgi:hypothetical protein
VEGRKLERWKDRGQERTERREGKGREEGERRRIEYSPLFQPKHSKSLRS